MYDNHRSTSKAVGHIPMSHLRIGDWVKARGDMFTQVYGLGHCNLNQLGTFPSYFFGG
jgi:hypothetical protein